MRTLGFLIVACAAFTGCVHANVTPATVDSGSNYTVSVVTLIGEVATCHLDSNAGLTVPFSPDGDVALPERFHQQPGNGMSKCIVTITDVRASDAGEWKIYFKDSAGTVGATQLYNFNVVGEDLATTVVDEVEITTPEALVPDPINNIERNVEYLDKKYINTKIGEKHTVVINKVDFVYGEKCLLQDPSGNQYDLTQEVKGFEAVQETDVECGVNVHVLPETIGDWVLIAHVTQLSDPIEKRLPFTIYVEEFVSASPSEVTVSEGNDLHLRLKDPKDENSPCSLIAPFQGPFEYEAENNDVCDYVVKNINIDGTGEWEITYNYSSVTYRAKINVKVTARASVGQDTLTWVNRKPVNITIGPEDAIYCIVTDPLGAVVYDGFGKCRIELDRASEFHSGTWTVRVGLAGRVLLEEQQFIVAVREVEAKPQVVTQVTTDKPAVMLTCSVNSSSAVKACKFRDPQGTILLAHEGVGESQYVFHGAGSSYEAGVHSHECGIKITDPATSDLGLWRCALETEEDTYYGFLAVLCPWSLSKPEVAAVVITEPTLTSSQESITREAHEPVSMSCSVQAPIRYCYFRVGNGTVYTVTPDHPHERYEYVGAGFDSGECGIRFDSLLPTDSGQWSCHVGLMEASAEQSSNIQLTIQEPVTTRVHWDSNGHLIVQSFVSSGLPLDYCRFVRMDGFGFLAQNAPAAYGMDFTQLEKGVCFMRIANPTVLDRHPWTVVAKITGRDAELEASTDHTLHGLFPTINTRAVSAYIWILTFGLGVLMLTMAYFLGPKKNRANTIRRVSNLRYSFTKPKPQLNERSIQRV